MRLAPGSFKISVNLNGLYKADEGVKPAIDLALQREIARELGKTPPEPWLGGGQTEWEIRQFEKRGLLGRLNFYYNGKLERNPY